MAVLVGGSQLLPGSHRGRNTLTFGYYVGKPYRIAATVRGRHVSAHFEAWSEDPSVTVFWFSPAEAGPGDRMTGLTAYDRHGEQMVSGNPSFRAG